jgi:hypothetical protein
VGTDIAVTAALTLTGADRGNYTLIQPVGLSAAIMFPAIAATHGCEGYQSPSSAMQVTNRFAYPSGDNLATLIWAVTLPSGWNLNAVGGDGNPSVAGTNVVFAGPFDTNPIEFQYTVSVPPGATISNAVSATVDFRFTSMTGQGLTAPVTPDPLNVQRFHVADYQSPWWVIDGTEVNRVLAYWRSGAYHIEPLGFDGYAAGEGNTNGMRHSADYQATYWNIDTDEANRVLAYWRAGAYGVNTAGDDNYATESDGGDGLAHSEPTVTQTGPAFYDPGDTVVITNTYSTERALFALCWKPVIPDGWTLEAVAGDGAPELRYGDILWTSNLPPTPVTFTYTIRAPLWDLRVHAISAHVGSYVQGRVNITQSQPTPATLVMAPRDSDGDGMPDGWENQYSGSPTAMNPYADDDGDGMANARECVAGTDPRDPYSVLAVEMLTFSSNATVSVRWSSATNRFYSISRCTDLCDTFQPLATNIAATPPVNVYDDTTEGKGTLFYKVEVKP